MGKHTYYTNCYTSSEYDEDFSVTKIDLPPAEFDRLMAGRALLLALRAQHPELDIESFKLEKSTAVFGDMTLENEDLNEEIAGGGDLMPERRGWGSLFVEHSTNGDRVRIDEYGVEWVGVCKYSGTHLWCDASWAYLEIFALRYGLATLRSSSDVLALVCGLVKSRDLQALPVLADALQEAGNPDWINDRFRKVGTAPPEDAAVNLARLLDGVAIQRLIDEPKPRKRKTGDGKKKLG